MTLTGLPIELLHHVAWYCAPHDVLALTETCRLLRDTYDDILFRQMFEYNLPRISSRSIASEKALVTFITDQLSRIAQRPLQDQAHYHRAWWKHLAVAVYHLSFLRDGIRKQASQVSTVTSAMSADGLTGIAELSEKIESLKRTIGLLATSVVWGCLSLCDEEVMRGFDELCACTYSNKPEVETAEQLLSSSLGLETAFCSAICAIQNSRAYLPQPDPEGDLDQHVDLSGLDDYREQEGVRIDYAGNAMRRYLDTSWDDYTYGNILPSMALLLCAVAARVCRRGDPKEEDAPPLPKNIAFFSQARRQPSPDDTAPIVVTSGLVESIPLPTVTRVLRDKEGPSYSLPATCLWELWYKARTRALIDDIESSVWEGTYTYGLSGRLRNGRYRNDPLMRHIRFHKSCEQDHRIKIMALACKDGVGEFALEGSVDLETFGIMIQKRYTGRHGFQWRGAVTPLGISGCYLSNWNEDVPLGAFWLWRRDWKTGI
ncbi:unnamed protein product [Clonostachys byssicola]|uniref:F-box domain-containing protein n=1 Tax=Clonostachys byssicola TaxID=160290 RepID=A0A9N9YBJ0_9HYPO|nr:unnamed protein product [Clonostachys byssicola]